ncbi:hypothetical protein PIB30_034705, partial [Stylosanthes scabra]|nr:hypothetical protein [Stylosanthes scabra]
SPTPSPERSKDDEVLDIPPIREMLPDDVIFHPEEDPSPIRPLKPLRSYQEDKIYNWVMKPSKVKGSKKKQ